MRKHFTKFLALTTVAVTAAVFTGCSSEDEPFADFESKMEVENPVSRAVVQGDSTIITFDDFESTMMAMPTSYGANYYGNTGSYAQVKQIKGGQAESTVHMLNWAIRSVKFLGVEFDQSEDEEVSVSDTTHL